MSVNNYKDLLVHKNHKIVCVTYGKDDNVSIECETCNEVLVSYDKK